MRFAIDENKNKIEVGHSGEFAECEICNSKVKGRKGKQRIKHWYHYEKRTIDCDNWHEPITQWHLDWQNLFPKNNREVIITENNITHRADIQLNNGLVIEIQNSPIDFYEIEKRESFYGKKGLIWILNGENLLNKSFLIEDKYYYIRELSISIPKIFTDVKNYDFIDIITNIIELTDIGVLINGKNLFEIKNENELNFKFTKNLFNDSNLIEVQYKYYIACVFERLYGQEKLEKFRTKIDFNYLPIKEEIIEYRILKKYWKKFIDIMKFPVYIDNLKGVGNNYIYYHTENKLIERVGFIEKYLKHT